VEVESLQYSIDGLVGVGREDIKVVSSIVGHSFRQFDLDMSFRIILLAIGDNIVRYDGSGIHRIKFQDRLSMS